MSPPQPADSASQLKNPRVLLAGGVVVLAVVLGVVLLAVGGGSSDDKDTQARVTRATLTLERALRPDTAGQELLVSIPGPELNTPEINNGEPAVSLQCLDASGEPVVRRRVDWPLVEEQGFPPHIHHPAAERTLDSIRRCTLTGPGIDFRAALSGALPPAE